LLYSLLLNVLIVALLYLCVYWPCYLYLKWLHTRRSRLYVMKRTLNMCIGAYVRVCLMMCAYRCLYIRLWLYDMLKCRNLGNYLPIFKMINNVISFSTCSTSSLSYLLIEWSWIEWVCGWLSGTYVCSCIARSRKSLLTLCAS